MKKTSILLALVQILPVALHAQTHYGSNAGTLGTSHSYFGYYAGNAATTASAYNAFFGAYSGRSTTAGDGNVAAGFNALYYNAGGDSNTAIGAQSLLSNTSGTRNVASGMYALHFNVTGSENTVVGYAAMYSNTDGQDNTASGYSALEGNTTGDRNVAIGNWSLHENTTGYNNTATAALSNNTTGIGNSAFGSSALSTHIGSYNSALGRDALYTYAPGPPPTCTSSYNCALGARTGTTNLPYCLNFNNTTALGYEAIVTASNQVRIGNSAVTSIGGQVPWTTLSDGRFKRDVKKDVSGLAFIRQLKPVSYMLDKDAFDKFLGVSDSIRFERAASREAPQRQIGFVAQEVEAIVKKSGFVFSGVETPQNEKDPYALRYAEFVVPLVKAVQELSAQIDARDKEIARLKETARKYLQDNPVDEQPSVDAVLFQNNPNPFSADTEIKMSLPETTRQANLIMYNLEGKEVRSIRVIDRGNTSVKISGNDFRAGIYLYALITDGKVVETKRLILTK